MPIRKGVVEEHNLSTAIAWEDLRTNYWSSFPNNPYAKDKAADAKSRAFGHRLRLEKLNT